MQIGNPAPRRIVYQADLEEPEDRDVTESDFEEAVKLNDPSNL